MIAPFVLDASVTAAWCFSDEATPASTALQNSLTERTAIVPVLWHTESANLLILAERRGRISAAQCAELVERLEDLLIETDPETAHVGGPIVRLARRYQLTIYDAVYLELAIRRGVELATRDQALIRAAQEEKVRIIPT
ncbi:MAG: type II toxin-antitoxin system VapC family toxin [Acetobacteraceae bacterium]|nr:type II toxin-antitoxin system VapC family toxin [Acetobacteraceae bacterium]